MANRKRQNRTWIRCFKQPAATSSGTGFGSRPKLVTNRFHEVRWASIENWIQSHKCIHPRHGTCGYWGFISLVVQSIKCDLGSSSDPYFLNPRVAVWFWKSARRVGTGVRGKRRQWTVTVATTARCKTSSKLSGRVTFRKVSLFPLRLHQELRIGFCPGAQNNIHFTPHDVFASIITRHFPWDFTVAAKIFVYYARWKHMFRNSPGVFST